MFIHPTKRYRLYFDETGRRAISGSAKLCRSDLIGLRVQQQGLGQYACRAGTARDR
jgi:hypothetical protein